MAPVDPRHFASRALGDGVPVVVASGFTDQFERGRRVDAAAERRGHRRRVFTDRARRRGAPHDEETTVRVPVRAGTCDGRPERSQRW
jgi:hypothetical protein